MTDGGENFENVREGSVQRAGALAFRRLGERLRLVTRDKHKSDDLVRVIETEVLPRLMLAHRQKGEEPGTEYADRSEVTDTVVDEFVHTLIHEGVDVANETILDLVAAGAALEDVFLKLLGPAACLMGAYWTSDKLSFVDVTIGLCRLHEILRANSVADDFGFRARGSGQPSILLAPMPGDQHVFGVQMAAEFFKRDGWWTARETTSDIFGLAQILARNEYDVVGLSLANEIKAADLASDVDILREASSNKNIKVILGGSLMNQSSEFRKSANVDLIIADAASAPKAARALLVQSAVSA